MDKYNYLDIFWIYLFIYLLLKLERIRKLEGSLDIFIYYIKIGEDWKIGGLFGYIYLFIYYIKIGEDWKIGGLWFGYVYLFIYY